MEAKKIQPGLISVAWARPMMHNLSVPRALLPCQKQQWHPPSQMFNQTGLDYPLAALTVNAIWNLSSSEGIAGSTGHLDAISKSGKNARGWAQFTGAHYSLLRDYRESPVQWLQSGANTFTYKCSHTLTHTSTSYLMPNRALACPSKCFMLMPD